MCDLCCAFRRQKGMANKAERIAFRVREILIAVYLVALIAGIAGFDWPYMAATFIGLGAAIVLISLVYLHKGSRHV
jgi:uncharacterized membrane-anchored protein YitT (DUF2179 family)